MILCVDTTALKISPDVQKDVNLEDILNNHTKYFPTVEEALKHNYAPLDFSVSVRSVYSNEVVYTNVDSKKLFYTNLTEIQPFVHKGYDLIMYLTSIGLMHCIDYYFGFDDVMVKHSEFSPIGLYNSELGIINPIIYSHIILSDEGFELLKPYLKSDRNTMTIQEMNENRLGNISALLDTLIEIKEEHNNEPHDNN